MQVTLGEELPFIVCLPLTGERPCLDFVNTIDWRLLPQRYRDALIGYSDLLAFCLRQNLISDRSYTELSQRAYEQEANAHRALTGAKAFRAALTAIIDDIAGIPGRAKQAQPRKEALSLFEAARIKAHANDAMVYEDGQFSLRSNPEKEGLDWPWLILVRDAESLLCSPLVSRIRVCAAEGCGWAFLDSSKNGSRRWCSMQLCGNREKARRFKRQDIQKQD